MRKLTSTLLLATLALGVLSPLTAQTPETKAPAPKAATKGGGRASPHETIGAVLGARGTNTRVTITYGRPYAKGRTVWGELVKWDKGDRLGADEATLLLTQSALQIGGATIQPGAYTLYIVPSAAGVSKLAISSNIGKWGIPVDETKDIARVELKQETLEAAVEQLTIAIVKGAEGEATLKISWANTAFSVPVSIKK